MAAESIEPVFDAELLERISYGDVGPTATNVGCIDIVDEMDQLTRHSLRACPNWMWLFVVKGIEYLDDMAVSGRGQLYTA